MSPWCENECQPSRVDRLAQTLFLQNAVFEKLKSNLILVKIQIITTVKELFNIFNGAGK